MRDDKGKFTTGNSGRPKGSKNKTTIDLRQAVNDLLSKNYETIAKDIEKLKPRERVDAWLKLLEYAVPKLQRSHTTIDIDSMSNEAVDSLYDKILNHSASHATDE